MSGTKIGGLKASQTNIERHGEDFYKRIGKKGGEKGNTGGFATRIPCECSLIEQPHYIANCAGYLGGKVSRRPKRLA